VLLGGASALCELAFQSVPAELVSFVTAEDIFVKVLVKREASNLGRRGY